MGELDFPVRGYQRLRGSPVPVLRTVKNRKEGPLEPGSGKTKVWDGGVWIEARKTGKRPQVVPEQGQRPGGREAGRSWVPGP